MTANARVEISGEAVVATLSGEIDETDYREVRSEVAQRLRESGLRQAIIDLRDAVLTASAVSIFSVSASNPRVIPIGVRYAVVCSPRTVSADKVRFGETVARNRGANLRTFSDLDAAQAWLAEPTAPGAD